MELKISCDASVKLKKMNGVKTINCSVYDYEIDKDTLSGNIKIEGKYIKDNLEEEYDFSDLVPFTVVFRDENFELNKIFCQNFDYNQIVNQGLECHFDIIIDYTKKELGEEKNKDENLDVFMDPELNGDIIKEEITEDEKISEKYDEMLKDILSDRSDNFLEGNNEIFKHEEARANDIKDDLLEKIEIDSDDQNINIQGGSTKEKENDKKCGGCKKNNGGENIKIPVELEAEEIPVNSKAYLKQNEKYFELNISDSNCEKEKIGPFSKTFAEKFDNYRVYYIKNESEVDRICKQENVNINDVYDDFKNNKRIIIK